MGAIVRRICAAAILAVAVFVTVHGAFADPGGDRFPPWRIERDRLRFKAVATDNVMALLAIRPGMTILDLGAGTGQFAYEFARRLDGTGSVYATDTNGHCVDYIKAEARSRGLGNLHPVLVARDGVDPFYRDHRFDLIAVFHLVTRYEERVGYFRELGNRLAKDGRLVLILYKTPTPFSPGDVRGDAREFLDALLREPAESPFHGILAEATRRMIREDPCGEPPAKTMKAVCDDLNAVLSNPLFTARFHAGSAPREEVRFLPDEAPYADWLLLPFQDNLVRMRGVKARSGPGNRMFETINKLLVMQRYRKYLATDRMFASGFTPSVRAAFEDAGYRVVAAYPDVVPFEDIVVFSAR